MIINSYDHKKGIMKIVPESPDDLWLLYNIIKEGDIIYANTTREIKADIEGLRPKKSKRMSMFLGISIEKFYLKSGESLRTTGSIVNGPEKFGLKGEHHSINIEIGKPLIIQKQQWFINDVERIKKAFDKEIIPIIIISIDDEESCIAILQNNMFNIFMQINSKLPGKLEADKRTEAKLKYFKKLLEGLTFASQKYNSQIIIIGPSFMKEDFAEYLKERSKKLFEKVKLIGATSNGGINGVQEALRSGILEKIAKDIRIIKETKVVEEVLFRLGLQRKDVSYGLEDIKKFSLSGAIDIFLITDEVLRMSENNERIKIEELMKEVEKKNGKVMIINTNHEAGKKLMGLGGFAALLRFSF